MSMEKQSTTKTFKDQEHPMPPAQPPSQQLSQDPAKDSPTRRQAMNPFASKLAEVKETITDTLQSAKEAIVGGGQSEKATMFEKEGVKLWSVPQDTQGSDKPMESMKQSVPFESRPKEQQTESEGLLGKAAGALSSIKETILGSGEQQQQTSSSNISQPNPALERVKDNAAATWESAKDTVSETAQKVSDSLLGKGTSASTTKNISDTMSNVKESVNQPAQAIGNDYTRQQIRLAKDTEFADDDTQYQQAINKDLLGNKSLSSEFKKIV